MFKPLSLWYFIMAATGDQSYTCSCIFLRPKRSVSFILYCNQEKFGMRVFPTRESARTKEKRDQGMEWSEKEQ